MLRAFAIAAVTAAPVAADPYEEIRILDVVAGIELDAIKGRCTDPDKPDPEAAAAAERAAHIHETRIHLARKLAAGEGGPGPEDLVPLAFQAADALARQFACDTTSAAPLESAHRLLAGLRAEMRDPSSPQARALDRRLAELDSQLAAYRAAHPPPPAATPTVRIVTLDGEVKPVQKDSTPLGRLALRLEVGASFVRAGEPPTYFYHYGPQTRLSVLARHQLGPRGRVHLLFGPYYAFARVTQYRRPDGDAWYAGPITSHRTGAQFEVQWIPAARLERWLSLNPALEAGLDLQDYAGRGAGKATGFHVGGGLSLCIWHQAFCPGARAVATPLARGNAVVAAQVGLALDLMRLADIGLVARSRRR